MVTNQLELWATVWTDDQASPKYDKPNRCHKTSTIHNKELWIRNSSYLKQYLLTIRQSEVTMNLIVATKRQQYAYFHQPWRMWPTSFVTVWTDDQANTIHDGHNRRHKTSIKTSFPNQLPTLLILSAYTRTKNIIVTLLRFVLHSWKSTLNWRSSNCETE